MRTSLNNIKAIDDYMLNKMAVADALLFEANTLLNSELADSVALQREAMSIVKRYGRQGIRAEIAAVQQTLTTAPRHKGFMQRITSLFKKH